MTNFREAIWDTLKLASETKDYCINRMADHPSLGWKHLDEMWKTIESDDTMSDTKLCRWLGWIQAAVVSWDIVSLDDMKEINKKYAD